ncbi:LRR 8 domain containing protein, partial [Asbolus verrucosus]
MTICDSFNDLEDNENLSEWTELIIGDDHKEDTKLSPLDLSDINFLKFTNLRILVINRQTNYLKSRYDCRPCIYNKLNLKCLSFYGNEMRYLEPFNNFPFIPLKKLSLVSNKIQFIKNGTFTFHSVEHFDMSNNLMEVIEQGALPLGNQTKIINIRNNELSYIEPGSFPFSLTTLSLDHNNLESIEDGVLDNLNNLEELNLSHNNLYAVPNIAALTNLKFFDISFNAIISVGSQRFMQVRALQFLDLSHNMIANSNILRYFILKNSEKRHRLSISLAFNSLKELNYTNISAIAKDLNIVLYGNPWDCIEWEWMKQQFHRYETIYCYCKQSYATICDNFEDIQTENDVEDWTELILEGEHLEDSPPPFDLTDINFLRFKKLELFIIANQIKQLKLHEDDQPCIYRFSKLKYLYFYGNEIKHLEKHHRFPLLKLHTLSLVNNRIEEIRKGTFKNLETEVFDVSNNLIKVIEEEALPLTNVTKVITIKNNKLSFIESGSFPSSLVTLNLARNNLKSISSDIFQNLKNLKHLILNHNNFSAVPDLSRLTELEMFDISFNAILTIGQGQFQTKKGLQLLDFSHNRISDSDILRLVVDANFVYYSEKRTRLSLSLAFNRLRNLKYTLTAFIAKHPKLILYGNPWDCFKWKSISKKLIVFENPCSLQHFSSGKTPYCVNYQWNQTQDISADQIDKDIDRFHKAASENLHLNN